MTPGNPAPGKFTADDLLSEMAKLDATDAAYVLSEFARTHKPLTLAEAQRMLDQSCSSSPSRGAGGCETQLTPHAAFLNQQRLPGKGGRLNVTA